MLAIARFSRMLVVFLGATIIPRIALAQDATAYQINPEHNGRITFSDSFTAPLKQLWRRKFGNNYVGFPLIANNMAFVTIAENPSTKDGPTPARLYALDLRTGALVWRRNVKPYKMTSWPAAASAYANGHVFILTGDCNLIAVSADVAGIVQWHIKLPDSAYFCDTSPVALGNHVYVAAGVNDGGVAYAVDQETGTVAWRKNMLTGNGSSPTEADGSIFFTYPPCQIYKFSNGKGALQWPVSMGCVIGSGSTAVYSSGRLFVRGEDFLSKSRELDSASGQLIRKIPEAPWLPVFWREPSGDYLQIQWESDGLYAHETKTYKSVWKHSCCASFDHAPEIAPIVVNNYVIYGDEDGAIYLLDAATGKLVWSKQASQQPIESDQGGDPETGSLAAAHGVLLVPADTELVAFGN